MSTHVADVSVVTYFAPILAFFIVFVLMYALLNKTKVIGENTWILLFVSFIIATIFVTAGSVSQVLLNVIPWFAILVVALFFILLLSGFVGEIDAIRKGVNWFFVILLVLVFIISGVKVFSHTLSPYLPGPYFGAGDADPQVLFFLDWLYTPRIIGAVLLLGLAALVSWVLVKYGK